MSRAACRLSASRWSTVGLAIVVLGVLLLGIPYGYKAFTANLLAQFLTYGLLAMSLGLIWGYGGMMSFGQTAFFGIGGYVYGIVALHLLPSTASTHLALLAGLAAALLSAALLGYFMFYGRISDVYASIITFAFTLVLYAFVAQTAGDEWVIGRARLGGFNGLLDRGQVGRILPTTRFPLTIWLPGMGSEGYAFRINRQTVSGYFLVVVVCALVYLLCQWLLSSRVGRVVVAIRENEARAASLGYDTRFYKTLLFTIGGGIAGLAGILFAAWGRFINPDCFGLAFASSVVVFVILGGRTHLLGGFVGALLTGYLTNYLGETLPFPVVPQEAPVLVTVAMEVSNRLVKEAPILAQGAVLVVMVLVLRDGLVPYLICWGQRHLWLCWLLLVPLVVAFYGAQVLCRQADICLWSGNEPHGVQDRPQKQGRGQAMAETILQVDGLTKYFGGLRAVHLHLEVHAGELHCLIGPNGAGKSTFFNLVTGRLQPNAGRITLPPSRHYRLGHVSHRPPGHQHQVSGRQCF